jgi:uncharacterized protein involved in response to NO
VSLPNLSERLAALPVLASPFRVFYLLGGLYAPALAIGGVLAFRGAVDLGTTGGPVLWHGHEMLFGFGGAIAVGTVLTALPSWAGIAELRGAPLAALAFAWVLGRLVFWAAPWLPWHVFAALDLLPWLALTLGLARPLWRLRNRLYRLLLPILLALMAADASYLLAAVDGDIVAADRALRAATWALMALYTLKGGVLTPVFTGNALRELGRGAQTRFRMPLEAVSLSLLVLLAFADLAPAPPPLTGVLALGCAVAHALRLARWQGWRVVDQPLLPAMHASFVWLLVAFVLRAAADFGVALPPAAWLHAFTVGALGLMMLSLMTRVSLRHTGRALVAPQAMRVAAWVMTAAVLLRLGTALQWVGPAGVAVSLLLWAACFTAYLACFAAVLLSPSLPRAAS